MPDENVCGKRTRIPSQRRAFALFSDAVLALLASIPVYAAQPIPATPFGYYEGTVRYHAEYFKDLRHMSMHMKSKSDFWFVVAPNGDVRGEGEAEYDFAFGIDWGMATSMGLSVVSALGVKIDPHVSIDLDPKTASQKFYLSGKVQSGEPPTANLTISWTSPDTKKADQPKLVLKLVGSVTGSVTGKAEGSGEKFKGSAETGGNFTAGTVIQDIKVDPNPPFGTDHLALPLRKRSPSGPYYVEFKYDGAGAIQTTGVVVDAVAVEKMDFERERLLAEQLKASIEAELRPKLEAELKVELEAKLEQELRVKLEAELKAKLEAELKAKLEAELKAKLEAELKAKLEAELKAELEAELRVKLEEELRTKLEAELRVWIEEIWASVVVSLPGGRPPSGATGPSASAGGLPDLVPIFLMGSISGGKLVIEDVVRNQGLADSSAFAIAFYLSKDRQFDQADVPLCRRNVDGLKANAVSPASGFAHTTCTVPAGAAGSYYVVAVVDPENRVAESDERNNTRATGATLRVP